MAELTDDDLILGPVTYFKYPSTSEYETEHGYDIQKAKQETNMFDNSYNDYNQRIDYTSSPYFPPQDLHNYGEMCQSGYNQNVNMYPYKSDVKQESLNYCQNEPEQCHSPMSSYHPNISQHTSYQQHPIQNGDYWNNGGWPSPYMSPQNYPHSHCYQPAQPSLLPFMQNINESAMKKRGRKKKIKSEFDDNMSPGSAAGGSYSMDMAQLLSSAEQQQQQQQQLQNEAKTLVVKERRKHDRFNGMPEEEVSKRTLPDLLAMNLDIVIIGINPGLFAAYKGHHYAGPGNHFWKCLYMSGLTTEPLTADDDYKLLQCGIGFTNMVERATKGSSDLTRKEIRDGGQVLLEKLQKFKPKIAVFNGKLIFEVFSGKKEFNFGRQPDFVDGTNTYMWVMPSSSARCAQLPRASDKVPYYAALKKFRDYLNGVISTLDENDLIFQYCKLKPKAKEELVDIKEEPIFYEEFDEEDSNGGGTASGSSSSCSPFKVDLIRKKIKCEEKSKPLASELSAVGAGSPADGVVVKKKRGRPKKIRPELMNPQPVPPVSAECDNSSPTSPPVAAPAASVDGTSSAVVTSMATPDATTITGNSKYFCPSGETGSSSPGCSTHLAEDISPSYQQNQFSSPSVDGGYYSQNSIESAFSAYDFHPSEIQSHLRSFLPSSKHESQCFLDE